MKSFAKRCRKVLLKAAELIREGEHEYVCSAIDEANEYKNNEVLKYLDTLINELLSNRARLQEWMWTHHPQFADRMGPADYRKLRLQWINYLIGLVYARNQR